MMHVIVRSIKLRYKIGTLGVISVQITYVKSKVWTISLFV